VLVRARELATQAASDTTEAGSRHMIASEIAELHDQLLAAANLEYDGAYLFSGYATDVPAFAVSGPFGDGNPPPIVSYNGDGAEIGVEIEDGVRIETTLDGRRVFLGDADGDGNPEANREDLFDVLASLWQALENDDRDAVGASLDRIARGQEQLDVERARVGGRLVRVEAADSVLSRRGVDLASRLSDAQDADAVEVYSALANQQALLQASLQITARAIQPSLLDFLG
jgi:flagellar hook-associated protein 3 FlgL